MVRAILKAFSGMFGGEKEPPKKKRVSRNVKKELKKAVEDPKLTKSKEDLG